MISKQKKQTRRAFQITAETNPPPTLLCFCRSTKTRPIILSSERFLTRFDVPSDRWSTKNIRLHGKKLLDKSNTQIWNGILQRLNGGKENKTKEETTFNVTGFGDATVRKHESYSQIKSKRSTYTELHCKTSKLLSLAVCKLNCLLHVWL